MSSLEAPGWLDQDPSATPYPDIWRAIVNVNAVSNGALAQMFLEAYSNRTKTIPTTPELFSYLVPRPFMYLHLRDHIGENWEYSPLTSNQWEQYVKEIMDDEQKRDELRTLLETRSVATFHPVRYYPLIALAGIAEGIYHFPVRRYIDFGCSLNLGLTASAHTTDAEIPRIFLATGDGTIADVDSDVNDLGDFLSFLFLPEDRNHLRALPEPELVLGVDYEQPIDLWTIACYYPPDTAQAYKMIHSLRETQNRSTAKTEFLQRDFTKANVIPPELTGAFDLAHASVVQYLLTTDGREKLLEQMALSLKPGGFLVETDMLDPQYTKAGDLFIPGSVVTRVRRKTPNGLTSPIEMIRYSKYPPDIRERGTSADCTTWYLNVEGIKQLMSGQLSI